jgi:hypothetical protein
VAFPTATFEVAAADVDADVGPIAAVAMATLVSRGAMHTGEVPISKHGGEDFASWPLSR